MTTLDASLVIAYLERADPHHVAAVQHLDEGLGSGFLIHPINLAEVLVGGVRSQRERHILAVLDDIGVRAVEPDPDQPMRLALLRVETGLKLPDCCVLDTALRTGSALGTVDRRLAAVARRRGVEVSPDLPASTPPRAG